jgi:hypothetical protein
VGIAIDENVPFDRQLDPLAQRALFFKLTADNSGTRFDNIIFNVHLSPDYFP